ncbi:MAG TPA: phosphatase PAP2 family protein [Terriglobales bacterium]|nr:phosphatase PAP2 family protein [Terriglobales bacterium]
MSEPQDLPPIERAPQPITFSGAAVLTSLAAAAGLLLFFVWLSDQVFEGGAARFDASVRAWVHGFASPTLTRAMQFASSLGSEVLVAGLVVSLVAFGLLRWKRAALWMVVTMAGALVLDLALKAAFHRTRPVPFFGPSPHTYSFPSGHSLFSFCFYMVLAGLVSARLRSPRLRVLVWTLAALIVAAIGLSRIYLGVHYPSDVLAGYLSAAMWAAAMITIDRARRQRSRKPSTE